MGREIDGRYVIESVIGRGAMGVVCAARHKYTGAQVAVKLARPELGLDREIESRFLVEARVPTAIDHPGVVKVLDAGKTTEGELYLVMELLIGRSLRDQMVAGVGAPTVRRVGLELLDALAATHARSVIHRDLKPENVFLVAPEGRVKILDFGLTKVLAEASARSMTVAGLIFGTLTYMAPEQLADAGSVDARADLWAVGVILYEMLAGRRPHAATTVEAMFYALVHTEPDPISAVWPSATPDIEAFFRRALSRTPGGRFTSAAEMAHAFASLPLGAAMALPPRPSTSLAAASVGKLTVATGSIGHAATAAISSNNPLVAPAARPSTGRVAVPSSPYPAHPSAGDFAPPSSPPPYPSHPSAGGFAPPASAAFAQSFQPAPSQSPYAPGSVQLLPTHRGGSLFGSRRGLLLGFAAVALIAALGTALVVRGGGGEPSADPAEPVARTERPTPSDPTPRAAPPPPAVAADEPDDAAAAADDEPELDAPDDAAPPATVERGRPATGAPERPGRRTKRGRRAADASSRAAPGDPAPAAGAAVPAAAEAAPTDDCAIGCKLLDTCHLGSASCLADCARSKMISGCLRQANNDCNRFAACWFAWSCNGRTTTGTHSCSEALDCEATCKGNRSCLCTCVNGASMSAAAALLSFNGCMLGCRNDAACVAARCTSHARRCRVTPR